MSVSPARVSAGIDAATAPDAIDELLRRADPALYAAKRGGRDRAITFERGRRDLAVDVQAAAGAA